MKTTVKPTRYLFICALFIALSPLYSHANSGRLDIYGCHYKLGMRGPYHCHKGPLSGQEFKGKAASQKKLTEISVGGEFVRGYYNKDGEYIEPYIEGGAASAGELASEDGATENKSSTLNILNIAEWREVRVRPDAYEYFDNANVKHISGQLLSVRIKEQSRTLPNDKIAIVELDCILKRTRIRSVVLKNRYSGKPIEETRYYDPKWEAVSTSPGSGLAKIVAKLCK